MLDYEARKNLLALLCSISPLDAAAEKEEDDLLRNFLPLNEYVKILSPQVFLVLGERGAGKTALFKALVSHDGYQRIFGEFSNRLVMPPLSTRFLIGYDSNRQFASSDVLAKYAPDEKLCRAYWIGSMCSCILACYSSEKAIMKIARRNLSNSLIETLSNLKTPSKWIREIDTETEGVFCFFDELDEHLSNLSRYLVITYDALDRICSSYGDLFPYIRTLLSFWSEGMLRWNNLRSKVLLRSDLYASSSLNFADSSKMRSSKIEIMWNTRDLYRLMVKRLMNSDHAMREYLFSIHPQMAVKRVNEEWGTVYVPTQNDSILERLMVTMVGDYMGEGPKKGSTYTWVPNHIQDSNGVLLPRPFLKCFVLAAERMLRDEKGVQQLRSERLLTPSNIQGALSDVSIDRVSEINEEYPWLQAFKNVLSGVTVPISKEEFFARIESKEWRRSIPNVLPDGSAEQIFDILRILGIAYTRSDGRINVPEIYLYGFGMKRRGGVKRPRTE